MPPVHRGLQALLVGQVPQVRQVVPARPGRPDRPELSAALVPPVRSDPWARRALPDRLALLVRLARLVPGARREPMGRKARPVHPADRLVRPALPG